MSPRASVTIGKVYGSVGVKARILKRTQQPDSPPAAIPETVQHPVVEHDQRQRVPEGAPVRTRSRVVGEDHSRALHRRASQIAGVIPVVSASTRPMHEDITRRLVAETRGQNLPQLAARAAATRPSESRVHVEDGVPLVKPRPAARAEAVIGDDTADTSFGSMLMVGLNEGQGDAVGGALPAARGGRTAAVPITDAELFQALESVARELNPNLGGVATETSQTPDIDRISRIFRAAQIPGIGELANHAEIFSLAPTEMRGHLTRILTGVIAGVAHEQLVALFGERVQGLLTSEEFFARSADLPQARPTYFRPVARVVVPQGAVFVRPNLDSYGFADSFLSFYCAVMHQPSIDFAVVASELQNLGLRGFEKEFIYFVAELQRQGASLGTSAADNVKRAVLLSGHRIATRTFILSRLAPYLSKIMYQHLATLLAYENQNYEQFYIDIRSESDLWAVDAAATAGGAGNGSGQHTPHEDRGNSEGDS